MNKVIDVRDMHTAIHSLFLVKRAPKTTLKLFKSLEYDPLSEWEIQDTWNKINVNVENLGEINYRNLHGMRVWYNGNLTSDVTYDDGENKYKVIGSFDLWAI